jgi:striatin 1/3/4
VTSIAISHSRRRIFSASLDSVIRVWSYPDSSHETYSAYDPTLSLATVVGHTDAIWDLSLIPSKADPEGYLVSACADGTVKVWDATLAGVPLFSSWRYDESGGEDAPTPVSIGSYPVDWRNVLIGFTNGLVKLYEVNTGRMMLEFVPTKDEDGEWK